MVRWIQDGCFTSFLTDSLIIALDTVLQRKAKNSVSGMLLISDASDSTRRAQMDLVLARAEAAK